MRGIIYLAFAGVAHLVERDLAKVEVASSSLVARSKKNTPSDRMGYSFWNAAGRLELAASTGAKRVKSRGEGRAPANGSAIRGMPGSEFEPRLFCCAKSVACGRVIEREWGNPQRFPPHTPPSLRYARVRTTKPVGNHKKKHHPDRMVFLFGMPRAGWNSLPRPARSASNRSVGDGVPDVPSARRCRAGNGFPRRFAPRSKCPWGTPRNDRGGVYRHAATIRQDGVSFLTVPGETPASGRAAPPAPRRSAPAGRSGRR